MVIHMRDQHQSLRDVGALKIKNSQINQSLMLQETAAQQKQLADTIKSDFSDDLRTSLLETIMMLQQNESDSSPPPPDLNSVSTDSANSISTLSTMESMVTLIKNLEKKVDKLTNKKTTCPPVTPTTNNNNTNKDVNPKTGKHWKRYCWTCGCCPHWGKSCPDPAAGHQNDATFKSRMDGSNKNCL